MASSSVLPVLEGGGTTQLPDYTGNPTPPKTGTIAGYAYKSTAPPSRESVHRRDGIQIGRWESELCSSLCEPNVCMTLICPFLPLTHVYARLGLMDYYAALLLFVVSNFLTFAGKAIPIERGEHADPMDVFFAEVRLYFIICMAGQVTFWAFVVYARYKVRRRFRIPGDRCNDCCVVFCCGSCCAIAQMATHTQSYAYGPALLPAYAD